MEIKQHPAFTSLCFSEQTTLAGIFKHVRVKARELYQDAAEYNLEVTGPVYWMYTGMDGNPETVFTLDIFLPVTEPEAYVGKFSIKTIQSFKSLSTFHSGTWEKLPETYQKLFMEVAHKSYSPTGVCREIYLHMDFSSSENNITEVQVGIQ